MVQTNTDRRTAERAAGEAIGRTKTVFAQRRWASRDLADGDLNRLFNPAVMFYHGVHRDPGHGLWPLTPAFSVVREWERGNGEAEREQDRAVDCRNSGAVTRGIVSGDVPET